MKRLYTFIVLFVFHTYFYAQERVKDFPRKESREEEIFGKVYWRVKAGLNISDIGGEDIDYIFLDNRTRNKMGYMLGACAYTWFSKKWGLSHGLSLNQRNIGVNISDKINGKYSTIFREHYIEMAPITAMYHIRDFKVFAGPYVSTLVAASIDRKDKEGNVYKDTSIFGSADNNEEESRYMQKLDYGFELGVDYDINSKMSLGATYNLGFADIFQYANSYTNGSGKTDRIRIYNRGFVFTLSYKL
ncbi:MAG: PorT family protein [Bergeyella sp.]|nr:PorT family protein [Bergeyella sp.]